MNERIEELAAIAKKQAQERYAHKMIPGLFSAAEFNQIFAELIIAECAERGSKAMYPDSDPDYVGRKIREHFGIEK
jgi:hypothetical protein